MERTVLAQGAAFCRPVAVAPLLGFMTERMRARLSRMDFAPSCALVAAFPYHAGRADGNIALFARGADYVAANRIRLERACMILRALYPEHRFIPSGNGWPLPAVHAARLAGLGKIGAHGMVITPKYGSFVTLGAILTDAALAPGEDAGYCEACGACAAACPTGAIELRGGHRRFDRERCLSHMTQKETLSPEQGRAVASAGVVLGCDLCQLACPHNRCVKPTALPEFRDSLTPVLSEALLDGPAGARYARQAALLRRNLALQRERLRAPP